jgi:Holliday junction resolvasome RuvABC endonuclease subunit
MVIIGFDGSVNKAGVVITDTLGTLNANGGVIYKELILYPKKDLQDSIHKMRFWKKEVSRLADKFNPDLWCIEDYAFGIGTSGKLFTIGEIGGTVKLAVDNLIRKSKSYHLIQILFIPPTVVKKMMTGKGNAKKSLIIKEVYKKGFETDDEDIADAWALTYCGVKYFSDKKISSYPDFRKKCILFE